MSRASDEDSGWVIFLFPALTLTTFLVQIYCGVMTPWKDGAKDLLGKPCNFLLGMANI